MSVVGGCVPEWSQYLPTTPAHTNNLENVISRSEGRVQGCRRKVAASASMPCAGFKAFPKAGPSADRRLLQDEMPRNSVHHIFPATPSSAKSVQENLILRGLAVATHIGLSNSTSSEADEVTQNPALEEQTTSLQFPVREIR